MIEEEELPGEHLQSDEELKEYVRSHAWGHHASCTCAIGPLTDGVLGSDFRVHKIKACGSSMPRFFLAFLGFS